YKCKICRRQLFTDQQVLHRDKQNLFVHILSWMVEGNGYLDAFGKVFCPHCGRKLGRYKWTEPYVATVSFKFGQDDHIERQWKSELQVPMVYVIATNSV